MMGSLDVMGESSRLCTKGTEKYGGRKVCVTTLRGGNAYAGWNEMVNSVAVIFKWKSIAKQTFSKMWL